MNTYHISKTIDWTFWGNKFEKVQCHRSHSLKSWLPASFLSKGLMLPMAHPWWHLPTTCSEWSHQFVNDLRTSALRKETKKPSGCGLTEPFSLYSPNKKHLDIGLKLLCARRGHVVASVVVLVVCCCCFLWLPFLLLLLQLFSLVITSLVGPSSTTIHITQSWEPKFHDHGDTDRQTMDSQ